MSDIESYNNLLQEFLLEGVALIDLIERGLLELEANPDNRALIGDVFRHMHTVKGNCMMLGFSRLEAVTHSAENVLERLREGTIMMNGEIGTALLSVVDCVRSSFKSIETTGKEAEADFSDQIDRLNLIHSCSNDEHGESPFCKLDLSESGQSETTAASKFNSEESSLNLESVTLPMSRVNSLMTIVGTVLVTFNQLRYCINQNSGDYRQLLDAMELQTQDLHEEVLKYRLQPLGHVFNTYHRLVRELAAHSGKKVYLHLAGEKTEVDRAVLLSLKNILGHLIRNSIDHGIEAPETRLASGKSAIGKIELSGRQQHGNIYIDIKDDGAGIDVAKVKEKAVGIGLVSTAAAESMDEAAAFNLIFEPGFSTAELVSNISGRGMGMDVVKKTIEKAGGTLSISSASGRGTTFSICIPQSMAIVPVLVVRSMGEQFALPQANVVELISFYGREVRENIEMRMHSSAMVKCRGRLLPLIRLTEALGQCGGMPLLSKNECHVVLLRSEEEEFGLEVDGAEELASLVAKPLARIFSDVHVLSASAVMPDGTVSFILNVTEIRKESICIDDQNEGGL
ncbi:MAG: ATP-binding protein [Candidatus Magnetominusculus sp. LBB02]|nr:ATP-binding protein [Candidatus Magnetominusculus sp. LBB02]